MKLEKEVFEVLWKAAIEEIDQQLHLFRMSVLKENREASLEALHAIKGVAGNFMLKSIHNKALKTEKLLQSGKNCKTNAIISELEKTINSCS